MDGDAGGSGTIDGTARPGFHNHGGGAGGGMAPMRVPVIQTATVAATAGAAYGGGANGGHNNISEIDTAGAAGSDGVVIVEIFG